MQLFDNRISTTHRETLGIRSTAELIKKVEEATAIIY